MNLRKIIPLLVIVALVAAAAVVLLTGDSTKRLVAHFPRTISIYEGSEVRVLGVAVGTVESVEPTGTDVTVTMEYEDTVKLPADAKAVIVAPSVVGDRYVQLTPAYDGGEVLADNTELDVDQTAEPLELDQIYESLDRLNVALGPNGANKQGALSDVLAVTADNFDGQGEKFNQTIQDVSRLTRTLGNNSEELFSSQAALGEFLETLARNDNLVRAFNQSLADVSTMLDGEREELVAATRNLGTALTEVRSFVSDNRDALGRNIKGLNRVTKVFVRQRKALDEIAATAPVALNNLALTYNPQAGTLDTRANIGESVAALQNDPAAFLCGFLAGVDNDSGSVCNLIKQLVPEGGLGRAGALGRSRATLPAQETFDPTLGGLVEVQR